MTASGIQFSFMRTETKYLLSPAQFHAIRQALQSRMAEDCYGLHTIENIYFDTPDFSMVRHSLDKPVYKEKFRVRSYGTPGEDSTVFAEIKKKFDGVVYKRRVALPHWQLGAFLAGETLLNADPQIQAEIHALLRQWQPRPACFIGYDRIALYGLEDPALRITFDQRLRWRTRQLSLPAGDAGEPVYDRELIVMEIKFPQSAPLWLARLLSSLGIGPASVSKVGEAYTRHIAPRLAETLSLSPAPRRVPVLKGALVCA